MYRTRHIHFVGVGGSGMSGIAEVLLSLGYHVSGSDLKRGEAADRVTALGGVVHLGHTADNVEGADVVVYSSAVHSGNPELIEARRRGVPVIPRAEMLGELMRLQYGIGIAGSHGKTTTTSMVGHVLAAGGFDPTVIVGGRLRALGGNARMGQGRFLVAESDESDGSFLRLTPVIAVITNIDHEHLDHHGSVDALMDSFRQFAEKVPFYGAVVACADDPLVQQLLPKLTRRVITYGLTHPADVRGRDVVHDGLGSRVWVRAAGKSLGEIQLHVPGLHNVYNALAAAAVGWEIGASADAIRAGLAEFQGVGRRFEHKGDARGVHVVDDYGHHPTEIRAVLDAAAHAYPGRRLVMAFQPHRYSRTQNLWREFGECFYQAAQLVLLPVYPAGEQPIEGVDSGLIARAVEAHPPTEVTLVDDADGAVRALAGLVREGDVVITQGAGDIYRIGERLLGELAKSTRGAGRAAATSARGGTARHSEADKSSADKGARRGSKVSDAPQATGSSRGRSGRE